MLFYNCIRVVALYLVCPISFCSGQSGVANGASTNSNCSRVMAKVRMLSVCGDHATQFLLPLNGSNPSLRHDSLDTVYQTLCFLCVWIAVVFCLLLVGQVTNCIIQSVLHFMHCWKDIAGVYEFRKPLATKQLLFNIAELEIQLSGSLIVDSVFEQSLQFFSQYCIH